MALSPGFQLHSVSEKEIPPIPFLSLPRSYSKRGLLERIATNSILIFIRHHFPQAPTPFYLHNHLPKMALFASSKFQMPNPLPILASVPSSIPIHQMRFVLLSKPLTQGEPQWLLKPHLHWSYNPIMVGTNMN